MFKFFKRYKIEKTELEYRAEKKDSRLAIEREIASARKMAEAAEIASIKQQLRQAAGLI